LTLPQHLKDLKISILKQCNFDDDELLEDVVQQIEADKLLVERQRMREFMFGVLVKAKRLNYTIDDLLSTFDDDNFDDDDTDDDDDVV